MPVSLKTQAERTAKTPIPACRARVGGLCGFRGTAERVPTGNPKPDIAPTCGTKIRPKPSAAGSVERGDAAKWTRPAACGRARDMKFAPTR